MLDTKGSRMNGCKRDDRKKEIGVWLFVPRLRDVVKQRRYRGHTSLLLYAAGSVMEKLSINSIEVFVIYAWYRFYFYYAIN